MGTTFIETIGQRGTGTYSGDNDLLTGDRLYNAAINRRWSQRQSIDRLTSMVTAIPWSLESLLLNQMPERLIKNMDRFAFEHTWRYVHLLMDFINDEKYTQALLFLARWQYMLAGYIRNPNMAEGHNDELCFFRQETLETKFNKWLAV